MSSEQAVAVRERIGIISAEKRFEAKIMRLPIGECWIWMGGLQGDGYGTFRITSNKTELAHRFSYRLHHGILPPYPELEFDHLCRNRCCVRPSHLQIVTCRENVLRGNGPAARQARQTHCLRGHPLIEPNLYRWGRKRYCKTCHRERRKHD